MASQNYLNKQTSVNKQATLFQSTCVHHCSREPSFFNAVAVSKHILDKEGKAKAFAILTLLNGSITGML